MDPTTAALALWAKRYAVGWLTRHWPKFVGAAVAIAAGSTFLAMTATSVIAGNGQLAAASNACAALGYVVDQAAYQPPPIVQAPTIPTGGAVAGFGPNDHEQLENAKAIVAAGTAAGVGSKGLVIAIATALQESGLRNLGHGDRDSLGLFQQRPSQGWGTPAQVQDPNYAALSFFGGPTSPHFDPSRGVASPGGLLDVAGWEQMPVTVAAQAVQRSAFPSAYAKHEARAQVIVEALTTGGTHPLVASLPTPTASGAVGVSGAAMTAADFRTQGVDIDAFCSINFEFTSTTPNLGSQAGQVIPAGEWTAPLRAAITSPFGLRVHPVYGEPRLHAGTDFHAAIGTPIAAPTVGVVDTVTWTSGGGLVLSIKHADGIETRHLHLSQVLVKPGDVVEGGQPVALSGDSGVGTGAHYHYEVHVDGTAVDPEPFMLQHGVNLRAWT